MKHRNNITGVILTACLALVGIVDAQPAGDVVMIEEEIIIRVEAELPTVMVTIARENPDVVSGELKRPEEHLLSSVTSVAKPKPDEQPLSKIENPKKMLAKERQP